MLQQKKYDLSSSRIQKPLQFRQNHKADAVREHKEVYVLFNSLFTLSMPSVHYVLLSRGLRHNLNLKLYSTFKKYGSEDLCVIKNLINPRKACSKLPPYQ